jgi:NagD protein
LNAVIERPPARYNDHSDSVLLEREHEMTTMPKKTLKLDGSKNYLIAIEGVLISSNQMIRGADRFIQRLYQEGLKFLLLTNNSRRTPYETADVLQKLGLAVLAENVFTSSLATARYLHSQKPGGTAFVIGERGLLSALEEVGYQISDQNPDYVVLGGSNRHSFEDISRAVNLIRQGAKFICTNPDRAGHSQGKVAPATGAMAALVEAASGIAPFFIGKPNPFMIRSALNYLGVHSEDTIMLGDNMETDIIAGLESGMQTILVLSGETQLEDLPHYAYLPTHVIRSVADLKQ